MKKLILLALLLVPAICFSQQKKKKYKTKKTKTTKGHFDVKTKIDTGNFTIEDHSTDSQTIYKIEGKIKEKNERTTIDTGNNYFFIKEFIEKEGKKETTYSNDDD